VFILVNLAAIPPTVRGVAPKTPLDARCVPNTIKHHIYRGCCRRHTHWHQPTPPVAAATFACRPMHFGRNAITHSWNQTASSRSRQENFLHDEYLPYAWDPRTLEWTAAEIHNAQRLDPETVVKVTSWHLGDIPGGRKGSRRTFAAMDCLRQKFGELPTQTVVMLQEVTRHLHRHILENLWVQHNFQLSNVLPRKGRDSGPKDISRLGQRPDWESYNIMASKDLPVRGCFYKRIPGCVSRTGALFMDLVCQPGQSDPQPPEKHVIRLCSA